MNDQESMKTYFEKSGLKVPPLYFDFFLSNHGTEEDALDVVQNIKNADIIALELIGWDNIDGKRIIDASFGREKPKTIEKNEEVFYASTGFLTGFLKGIYNRHVPFIFFDVIFNSDIHKRFHQLMTEFGTTLEEEMDIDKKYEIEVEIFKKNCERFAQIQNEREVYMQNALKEKLREFLVSHPDYQHKDSIHISVFLGMLHTKFCEDIKKYNENCTIKFQHGERSVSSFTDMILSNMEGKEISQERYKRTFAEMTAAPFVNVDTIDRSKRTYYIKELANTFTKEDMKKLYISYTTNNEEMLRMFLSDKVKRLK